MDGCVDRVDEVRPPSCHSMRRSDMLNKDFHFEGDQEISPSRWRVRRIEGNTYVCTRLTEGGTGPNIDKFDIGFVIRRYEEQIQFNREQGPLPRHRSCRI